MNDTPESTQDEPLIRKRPGRPPGIKATAPPTRGATRQPSRSEQPRSLARDPDRGDAIVQGRNGETLSRKSKAVGDPYDIPKELIPRGWEYQWNPFTVVGQQATDAMLNMHANGWRPVPANRHPGMFVPVGEQGAVVKGGLRLEERPIALSQEARAEELDKARGQMRDQTESLRLSKKLSPGFEVNKKYRGTGGEVRMSIDRALDIPAPQHTLAEPGE